MAVTSNINFQPTNGGLFSGTSGTGSVNASGITTSSSGSGVGAGQIAGAVSGAANLFSEAAANLSSNDAAKDSKSQFVAGDNFDQIASNYGAYRPYDFGWEHPFWEGFKGSHKSGLTGAAAGSNFGPWGTLIGAVAGSLTGGFSGTFGALKRNKEGREAEEKWNTLDMNRFEANADKARQDIIGQSMVNYAAFGGKLSSNGTNFGTGLTEINAGGSHELNPNGGVQQGIDAQGTPNMVEEGETILKSGKDMKAFTNRLVPEEYLLENSGLPKSFTKKSFAEASKVLGKITKERPNDIIANKTLHTMGSRLFDIQETQKQNAEMEKEINSQAANMGLDKLMFAKGGSIHIGTSKKGVSKNIGIQEFVQALSSNKENSTNKHAFGGDVGMYAPAVANAGILANTLSSRVSQFTTPRMVNNTYLDENMPYSPIDTNYLANLMGSTGAGNRRALLNTSGGNRATAAALIAGSDYGLIKGIGDMYMKAGESNLKRLTDAKQAKNQARQTNAQLSMSVQDFNSKASLQDYQINTANQSAKSQAVRDGILALAQNFSDTSAYNKRLRTVENMYGMYDAEGNYKPKE